LSMFGLTLFFIALAAFFFFVYGRRKIQSSAGVAGVPARPATTVR
jgi:hypothetical protein